MSASSAVSLFRLTDIAVCNVCIQCSLVLKLIDIAVCDVCIQCSLIVQTDVTDIAVCNVCIQCSFVFKLIDIAVCNVCIQCSLVFKLIDIAVCNVCIQCGLAVEKRQRDGRALKSKVLVTSEHRALTAVTKATDWSLCRSGRKRLKLRTLFVLIPLSPFQIG